MVLTVYKVDASPPARAVLMTVEALGIPDVEFVDVNLVALDQLKDEYLQMNPQHTIPTLKEDDGFVVWDSHAITTYLVNKYAESDELYPADIRKRALIDQRLHFDTGILFPPLRNTVELVVFRGETSLRPEILAKVITAYDLMEKFLSGSWLAGDDFTLADICCVASVSTLNVLVPIDENTYPKLSAWLERCAAKDFYKKLNVPGVQAYEQLIKSKLASNRVSNDTEKSQLYG